ncbi:putative reverse transcriptase domain-containing protein, partial [Tanacetum coccineum]
MRYAIFCRKACWDSFGEYAVHCKELSGFKYGHNIIRDVLFDICRHVRISAKEKALVNFLTDPADGRSTLKTTDVLVFGWVGGKHAVQFIPGNGDGVSRNSGLKDIHQSDGFSFDALVDLPSCSCEVASKIKNHNQLLRLMQFLMGLDDMFSSVRSLILTTEPLPDVKFAFATLSRDESHMNSNKTTKFGSTAFVVRPGNTNKWNSNKNGNTSKTHASVADVTELNWTVLHPNRTMEQVKQIGNYKLGNDLIIKDVLVVPGYHVSLLSGHKLSRDNKNGVSERKHMHLLNTARALMFQGGLPLNMWPESILTATYLINMLPTAVLSSKSPYDDSSHRSYEPNDDGGDSVVNSDAPNSSTDSLDDSTVDDAAKDQDNVQTYNIGSDDLFGSSSSRKVSKDSQYATK